MIYMIHSFASSAYESNFHIWEQNAYLPMNLTLWLLALPQDEVLLLGTPCCLAATLYFHISLELVLGPKADFGLA